MTDLKENNIGHGLSLNTIYNMDCIEGMKLIPDCSIDSIITDPPYEIGFMGKGWDDTGIANNVDMWKECLRVLKPGGHLLSFAATRTYHRMACAIDDAGFEVRDMIEWVYGSGFPKSLNIGKAVDKLQGNEREVVATKEQSGAKFKTAQEQMDNGGFNDPNRTNFSIDKGTSEWEGWGTALKPAHEPICMARKPLAEKTVAENVLKYGTGGINIDESRVDAMPRKTGTKPTSDEATGSGNTLQGSSKNRQAEYDELNLGRFPANLILEDCEEVRECFPETKSGAMNGTYKGSYDFLNDGIVYGKNANTQNREKSEGNASRFFKSIIYQAKASKSERNKGLDGQVLITIMGVLLFTTITECTEKHDQNQLHLLDIEVCPQKEGLECEIKISKGKDLSISLYEKLITDQSLNECKSIISTTTNGTMTLAILNWLTHCITREYTADVNGEIEFGENLVENAEGGKRLTTTIKGKIEFLHDVKNAASEMQLIIKERENKNYHSTVKPIALMEYLIKMVTKEGGTVLDPFVGSGTTLVAAKKNGYNYIGFELDNHYVDIANKRIQDRLLEK